MTVFASRSVPEHLLRGLGAAGVIAIGVWLLAAPGPLRVGGAVLAFIGSAMLMRGCPTCWLVGLIDTVANRANLARPVGVRNSRRYQGPV